MKKIKIGILLILIVVIASVGITSLKKFNRNQVETVDLKIDNNNLSENKLDLQEESNEVDLQEESNEIAIKEIIESKIKQYIYENGKEYSNDVIKGENSFFVGGIGKNLNSYDINEFKVEDFDVYGLINSVPENCNKFGAEVVIENEDIIVNIYTEKDKFYKDE